MAVPMAAVVQYKGFRAFVNIGLNFKDYEVAFGLNAGRFVADFDLMKGMNQIGKKLNIMPHTHKSRTSSGAMIEVPLSQGIKVYKTQKKNQEDLYKDQD
jgi:Translation initiation factor eIF3 subunit 135/Tetratricopeptide repeat